MRVDGSATRFASRIWRLWWLARALWSHENYVVHSLPLSPFLVKTFGRGVQAHKGVYKSCKQIASYIAHPEADKND